MALGAIVERPEPQPPVKPPWDSEAAWIKDNPRPRPSDGAAKLKSWDDARRKYITETLPKYKAEKAAYDKSVREKALPPRKASEGTKGQILDPKTGEPIKWGGEKGPPGAQGASGQMGMPPRYVPKTDAEIHRAAIDRELQDHSIRTRMKRMGEEDSAVRTKFMADFEAEGERRRAANIAAMMQQPPPPRAIYNPVRAAQTMPSYAPRPMPSGDEMLARYAPRPQPSEQEMLAKYAPQQQPSEEELLRRYAVQDALRNY